MAKNNKPYGFVYVTHLPDGRYYIGQHKIKNHETLDPEYYGSGILIQYYLKSHGNSGLRREILATAQTREELNLLESTFVSKETLEDAKCLNLDIGGKGVCGRPDDVRQRISAAIAKKRRDEPNLWKVGQVRGSKTCRWKFISPEGEIYEFEGPLKTFCDQHGLSPHTVSICARQGWIPRSGRCAGWQIFNLTTGKGTIREPLNHGEPRSGKNNPSYKARIKRLSISKNSVVSRDNSENVIKPIKAQIEGEILDDNS